MTVGMVFCALGFVLSGFVQLGIDNSIVLPSAPTGSGLVSLLLLILLLSLSFSLSFFSFFSFFFCCVCSCWSYASQLIPLSLPALLSFLSVSVHRVIDDVLFLDSLGKHVQSVSFRESVSQFVSFDELDDQRP